MGKKHEYSGNSVFASYYQSLGYVLFEIDLNSFQGRLKAHRMYNGITHKQIAKVLGVNATTIGAWEAGEHVPKTQDSERLARMFNEEVKYF